MPKDLCKLTKVFMDMQIPLSDFWLTADPIDLEHKKYLMLAYDQKLTRELHRKKIYPYLTDVVDKLQYVNDFLRNMVELENSAVAVDHIDWIKKEVVYKKKITDDTFNEVKEIAIMSRNVLADLYIRFKNLYDEVDGSIVITGTKFTVFDKYDGYLQVKYDMGKKEKILYYDIYRVMFPEPTFHLHTSKASMKEYYGERFKKNIFEVIMNENYPAKETSIPVFRRKFLLYIMGNYVL